MEQIGAYYQCFKNKEALNFVLSNYRKWYPDTTIVLLCDGGEDFTEESKKFNCRYIHDYKISTKNNLIFNDLDSTKRFIERLSNNINQIIEPFFILLEDDVYIVKKVESSLLYDINGCNQNEFFSDSITSLIKRKNTNLEKRIFYGSFGGCILNTSFFKQVLQNKIKINADLNDYNLFAHETEFASDKILTYLCLINGGSIGPYNGFCETWYDDYEERLKLNDIEVLHKYKKHY